MPKEPAVRITAMELVAFSLWVVTADPDLNEISAEAHAVAERIVETVTKQ